MNCRIWYSCKKKIRHATKRSAKEYLAQLKQGGTGTKNMEVYPCIYCLGFHVGHKLSKEKKKKLRKIKANKLKQKKEKKIVI